MIFKDMTTEELFQGLQKWNEYFNTDEVQNNQEKIVLCQFVIDEIITTLQLHWL
jgi:hypothetical protein